MGEEPFPDLPRKRAMLARMMATSGTKGTEAKWAERVRAWRASGETAHQFAARYGFAASTLHAWSSRLSQGAAPGFVRVVAKRSIGPSASEVVVEVGGARVRVASGFDCALLTEVVRVLSAVAR